MPETYGRAILRTRNRWTNNKVKLPAAQSGVTIAEMAKITFFTPLRMLVTEPIVVCTSLYLGLNFAVVFQWFITVPVVLSSVYNFSIQRVGLAMIGAIGGVLGAMVTSIICDRLANSKSGMPRGMPSPRLLEKRLYPAMIGSFLIVGSLFWIGFTASPRITFLSPIFGTAIYVWGNALVLVSVPRPRPQNKKYTDVGV